MAALRFAKGHALGNDYLVIDAAELPWPMTPALARLLCDRHRGIGSDGLLLADLSGDTIRLRIINPDGTEAEKSGNGLRIFGAWLHDAGRVADDWFRVALIKDEVAMRVEGALPGGALMIRAEMGRATFQGEAVGYRRRPGEVVAERVGLPHGHRARITTVSLSNPHCVVFVDRLDREDFLARAPLLCTYDAFAAGTNVQFARIVNAADRVLEAWIWERGAGETLASGSSACAVAAAAVRRGFAQAGTFEVRMPGGKVSVDVAEDWQIRLLGPAQIVFTGELTAGAFEEAGLTAGLTAGDG
jgi:diaminopimelate epimerase